MRALLVDDERLARVALRRLLNSHDDIVVVGEARNAGEAASLVRELHPDLVFLDVEMPGENGIDVLRRVQPAPPVVFTTAYQQYAVRAFEVNALDYLLKPILAERLSSALDRARKARRLGEAAASETRQILLREGSRSWTVGLDRILALESQGNYTRVYFGINRPLIHGSLSALGDRLDPSLFFRVSRMHIVNLQNVESLEHEGGARLTAILRGGLKVVVSRRQARRLRRMLQL